jgi:hypothetical protein
MEKKYRPRDSWGKKGEDGGGYLQRLDHCSQNPGILREEERYANESEANTILRG